MSGFAPSYPCGPVFENAVKPSDQLANTVSTTVYEYKIAYEAATNKPYRFKTQQERMAYMMEAMKPVRCITR